uniref:GOLD domain-containing protein n=1 Tax=Ciona savignyi TaxID=51511 RepID=H2YV12_CIOSA
MAAQQVLIFLFAVMLCVNKSLSETKDDHLASFEIYESKGAKHFFSSLLERSVMHEFTTQIRLPRGSMDCFFEHCKNGSELICIHQVQSPGAIINSFVALPNRTIISTQEPGQEVSHRIVCPDDVMYAFCLDNKNDHYNSKVVRFRVTVLHHNEVAEFHMSQHSKPENDSSLGTYRLYDHLYQVATDVMLASNHLAHSTSTITRDWETLKSNMFLVKLTSVLAILITGGVGFAQVFSVKRMFRDNTVLLGGRGINKL